MSAVPQQMQRYLASCSPDQIAAILETIQSVQAQSSGMPYVVSPQRKKRSGNSSKRDRKRGIPRPDEPVRAAKRPLNSWMAFRSYYSPIFTSMQQKDISGFLTTLWQADPFKAKWTILAKAYSIIRDRVGKIRAPLDGFLSIACPHIGIINDNEYLNKLGWEIVELNGVRKMDRTFTPDVNSFAVSIRTTNLSVEDVVLHCRDIGYFVEERAHGTLTLAAEPTTAAQSLTMVTQPVVASAAHPSTTAMTATTFGPLVVSGSNNVITSHLPENEWYNSVTDGVRANTTQISQQQSDNTAHQLVGATNESEMVQQSMQQNFGGVVASMEMDENAILLAASGDSYPFNDQFNPDDEFGLHFNPFAGDRFNAFDINNFDINAFLDPNFWNI